ncbi:MAG: VRR-NUC domain-containing protein [Proteobacteria bacterium]|nr:VRR-NUC domain-containing protein [Pseudomonadota bacterium]
MPHDFFIIEFYQRRRSIIDNRFRELENSNLIEKLSASYHNHHGQNCRPIENWDKYSLDGLTGPLGSIPNTVILGICRRLLSDFGYNRAGLPDLIVYRQGEFLFAEVKSKNDKLSQKQLEWHDYLTNELSQKVEIILINHTDRQIANIKKDIEPKGGKEVEVSFGSSTSKKRAEAIAFISQQKGFSVVGEGKDAVYSAVFNTAEIEVLYTILELTSGWKSQTIEMDGQVIKSTALRNGLYCFRQKNQEHASDAWCNQTAYGEGKNPFGCKRIYFRQLEDNQWDSFGYVDTDKGEWVFDIPKIRSEIDKQFSELQFCPLFDSNKVEKAVSALPERVNPMIDTDWAFRGQGYNIWIFHEERWISRYGDEKNFPGFAVMTGVEKLSKKDRSEIIRSTKRDHYTYNVSLSTDSTRQPAKRSSGCFITTAVYGSYDSPQVLRFRQFRDQALLRNTFGRLFIKFYYQFGPYMATFVTKSRLLKAISRAFFDCLLKVLKYKILPATADYIGTNGGLTNLASRDYACAAHVIRHYYFTLEDFKIMV